MNDCRYEVAVALAGGLIFGVKVGTGITIGVDQGMSVLVMVGELVADGVGGRVEGVAMSVLVLETGVGVMFALEHAVPKELIITITQNIFKAFMITL